jgi:hypothetical protein
MKEPGLKLTAFPRDVHVAPLSVDFKTLIAMLGQEKYATVEITPVSLMVLQLQG